MMSLAIMIWVGGLSPCIFGINNESCMLSESGGQHVLSYAIKHFKPFVQGLFRTWHILSPDSTYEKNVTFIIFLSFLFHITILVSQVLFIFFYKQQNLILLCSFSICVHVCVVCMLHYIFFNHCSVYGYIGWFHILNIVVVTDSMATGRQACRWSSR